MPQFMIYPAKGGGQTGLLVSYADNHSRRVQLTSPQSHESISITKHVLEQLLNDGHFTMKCIALTKHES